MHSQTIDSTVLAAAAYDDARAVLEVEFRDGTVYQYRGVPRQTFQDLCRAESKGGYFNRQIRSRFACVRLAPTPRPCLG